MRVASRRNNGGTEAVISMSASFNGAAFGIEHMEGYSVSVKAVETSATLAGTLKLQASNTAFLQSGAEDPNATWSDITGASESVSGSGTFFFNVSDAFYKAVRLVWTRSTGQGTADICWQAKGPQS